MADFVVDSLVEHLSKLLAEEANSFGGVEDQVKSLHRELGLINIFLKNSEGKRSGHEMVEGIIWKIMDVAFEAEDVIDTIIFNVATQTDKPEKIDSPTNVKVLHNLANKIESLNEEINKIYDNIEEYGIGRAEANADASMEAVHKRRREVEEDDVVGFDYPSEELVERLTRETIEFYVISIVGQVGSGKTTLARKIYNNVEIKSHFNFRVWVYASYDFSTREVLLEILKSEMPKSDELTSKKLFKNLSEDELKRKLFKCLQGKRYLVVLDNICRTKIWDEVRLAFPNEWNGSRVLITGNMEKVSSHPSHLSGSYLIPYLNRDESWKLLSKKVFRGGKCPLELETLGRRLAIACCGLPLTIVLLAGILANKDKKYETWAQFIDGGIYRYPTDILEVCYFNLPRRLKPCLLYLGVFPKGFEISVRLLINLWVAEGFIQHTDNLNSQDIAEGYLEELIDRGLVQVASSRTDGGVKTCRIRDVVQDLCIQRSLVDKFLQVLSRFDLTTSRRVSFQGPLDAYIPPYTPNTTCVRSLLFFNRDTYGLVTKHWKWIHEFFRVGRVLSLGHVNLYSFPTMIAKLISLRYLGIESDALRAIPPSIGNLINLETLDMRGTFLKCLSKGIWKLRLLKNLYMSGPVSLPNDLDSDVEALCNLQVFSTVALNPQSSLRIPNIRKLGIWFASDESNNEVVDVLKSVRHLHRLRTLKVINCSECHCLPMSLPSTITKITLRRVRLEVRRDMRVLGKLPNLQILKLQSCILSSKLHVFAGSFPRLQFLKFENLGIKKWKQRRGAMPCLKHLVIKRCTKLTMLPLKLQTLTTLQDVEVLWSTSESALMLQELQRKFGFNLLIYPPLDVGCYATYGDSSITEQIGFRIMDEPSTDHGNDNHPKLLCKKSTE